jgi:hypothetical protein
MFRRLVTDFFLLRPGLDLGPIHMRVVLDAVTLGHISFQIFRFISVSIIQLILQTFLCIKTALLRRTSGRKAGTFNLGNVFLFRVIWMEENIRVVVFSVFYNPLTLAALI